MLGVNCSNKYIKSCENFCQNIPDVARDMMIYNLRHDTFNVLVQVKAIKDCGCLEYEEQIKCYNKFKK
jgi:hypothetical protein